jgi:DNA repair protein RecO (recombination protein O)
MLEHTRGIVLNLIKYSDSASIAHVYTEKSGRVTVMVRHPKSKKSVSKKSILQPLFLLDMELSRKQNREIQYSGEFSNSPVFQSIPFHVFKSSIAIFLAEVLGKVLREEEPNPAMFNFLFNSVILLDQMEQGFSCFHLVFLYELTRYLGFYPADNYSLHTGYFNLREGTYTNLPESPQITLSQQQGKEFMLLRETGFEKMAEIQMTRTQRNELLKSLLKYYYYHLPEMGHIKSFEVLTEIFNG